ncbi:hypothetical protein EZV62_018455 [Acer yangbiense]|uniref:CCHC-type domain-containing protein n=1 Tax=Acer yangbiense TaxID=1000413 RepID=A0A5C7HLB9_9ROSI|nr:hypothetical protein EZV62_018455 [Acer yangbiense]
MTEADITKLYENLSITDEDVAIHEMLEATGEDGAEDVERCLVGKVLAGKNVNREAFKGIIEQIWSPFGHVEIELVSDNVFMFYFINSENRNRVWHRGPWHFGNSLIVLENPVGSGNIAQLAFNKADFWVQIHEIPILCMNRKTAKWLAEHIGEVVDIPSESRECWGKYMRVKVRIDITKPLKRWLRLKLGKTEEVTRVSLKYERLPEFCFTCGKIGHGIKVCIDEEARKMVVEGYLNRFGSWLKAPVLEKSKSKSKSKGVGQGIASSSKRTRSIEASRDTEEDVNVSLRSGSTTSHQNVPIRVPLAPGIVTRINEQQTLQQVGGNGPPLSGEMCIDGPGNEVEGSTSDMGLQFREPNSRQSKEIVISTKQAQLSHKLGPSEQVLPVQIEISSSQPMEAECLKENPSPNKKKVKRWKRAAREAKKISPARLIASPLHRMLGVNKQARRSPKGNVRSSSVAKFSGQVQSERQEWLQFSESPFKKE